MTSKERIRCAVSHETPDCLPKDFLATGVVMEMLQKHLGLRNAEDVYRYMGCDVRTMDVLSFYNGKTLQRTTLDTGEIMEKTLWGYERKQFFTGQDWNLVTTRFALDDDEDINDALDKYTFPNPDDFDYSQVEIFCDQYPDKAIMFGHAGAYQMAASNLRKTDLLFMDMATDPDGCHRLFDGMVKFLLEHYKRVLEAGKGKIDILRIHDDYGTQISTLFSKGMWREFFKSNLKKFVDLAHHYNAFLMQHSCGAIRTFIPDLIACGVDILDPVQKVAGLEPEGLKAEFGEAITFHGGIDTQFLLPNCRPDEVAAECRRYIEALHINGGYVFTSSQHLMADVPVENILAMYNAAKEY